MQLKHIQFFLINAIKFLVTFFLVYLVAVFLLCEIKVSGKPLIFRACQGLVWKGGYTFERFKEFNPGKKYDILVFGSSRANRGITPRVFDVAGYDCYNLATDDQTPINTNVLVHQYVKPDNCRLVIIDIYDKVFTQPHLESTADLIQNVNENKTAVKMAYVSNDIRALNFLCVRMMMQNAPPLYEGETDLYKGFRELNPDSVSYTSNFLPYKTVSKNLAALLSTIKYLKKIKVPFLLVSQPMIFYKHAANHSLFLDDLKPLLEKNGVTFYNFTDDSTIVSINDYADECHFNADGANKYSKFLLDNIIAKAIKPQPLQGKNFSMN